MHMTDEDALVEELARAICAASGDTWREGPLRGPGMGNRDSDSLNNHWRHKARTILPIVNARLDAITKERDELRAKTLKEPQFSDHREARMLTDADMEICPDCCGAGGDSNTFTCSRCDGQGMVPFARRTPMTDILRTLAGIGLGMVSILCFYAFTEKLK